MVAHPGAELYGSDRVMLESVEAFVRSGARVITVLPNEGPLIAEIIARGGEVVIMTVPVLRKSMLSPRGLVRLLRESVATLSRARRLIRETRPSGLYVSTLTIPIWMIVARLNRVPVLTHVHEAEDSASPVLRWLLVAPLSLSTRIVANSEFSVRVLGRSLKRVGARTLVVHNAVPGPPTAERQDSNSGLRVVYVGRLSPRKGVDVAVDAVRLLRERGLDATLDIVGDVFPGFEWYRDELVHRISGAGMNDAVRFHGFQNSVWPFLAAADVVVVPSRIDEPFGNTAVEAALAARPAVVSNTSGLREAGSGYAATQFVAPDDAGDTAGALERVLNDRARFFDDALHDRDLALEKHGLERYWARMNSEMAATTGTTP